MKNNYTSVLFLTALSLLTIGGSFRCPGQDKEVIYLVDESVIRGKIVELTAKRVKYQEDASPLKTVEGREVSMIFNKAGEFLLFPPVSDEAVKSFLKTKTVLGNDLIVTLDKQLIVCSIISVSETEVMFEKADEGEFALGKEVLAAIIFKSGKHELFVSPSQAAELLGAVKTQIDVAILKSSRGLSTKSVATASSQPVLIQEDTRKTRNAREKIVSPKTDKTVLPESGPAKETASGSSEGTGLSIEGKEYELLRKKAMQKITSLNNLLKIIIDTRSSPEKVRASIDQACLLFVDEDVRVEVASVGNDTKDKYKIRDYLARLSLKGIEYKKVEADYINLNYVFGLTKGASGNYEGAIEFYQTLKGLKAGKPVYGTLTKRQGTLVQKSVDGTAETPDPSSWDVFFSDIGVFETRK